MGGFVGGFFVWLVGWFVVCFATRDAQLSTKLVTPSALHHPYLNAEAFHLLSGCTPIHTTDHCSADGALQDVSCCTIFCCSGLLCKHLLSDKNYSQVKATQSISTTTIPPQHTGAFTSQVSISLGGTKLWSSNQHSQPPKPQHGHPHAQLFASSLH